MDSHTSGQEGHLIALWKMEIYFRSELLAFKFSTNIFTLKLTKTLVTHKVK